MITTAPTPIPVAPTSDDVLLRAARIIRQGWCKFSLARDKDGNGVSTYGTEAVTWCAMGAIDRATRELTGLATDWYLGRSLLWEAVDRAFKALPKPHTDLVCFNNAYARDAEEIAEVFEHAAATK